MSAAADQAKLYDQWKAYGDPKDLAPLMQTLEHTVQTSLKTYANGNEALKTRAYILAREALDTYDPKKSALNTHVSNNLKRLYRVSADRYTVVHVPENVRTDALAVQRYINQYKDENDIEPSDQNIADTLKMSKKRVAKALRGGRETLESAAVSEKGDIFSGAQERSEEDIWKDYVYADLSEDNRKVFEWTTGYNGSPVLPKGEVAKRLKISNAAVSQRINTIQKRLAQLNELPSTGPSI